MSGREYDDNNTGTLGRNENRQSDRSPDYTGKCTIDGREYYISAWVKERRSDGKKFFSLAYKPVETSSDELPL